MPFLDRRNNSRTSDPLLWEGDRYSPEGLVEHGLDGTGLPATLAQAQRRLCGNVDCASGWTMPWRSRRRPIFEEQWGCSGRCVLAMVRDALRREVRDGMAATEVPHRHRVPLGLLMLGQGWITHPQLRQALEAQRQNGTGRIGEWLIAECGLEAEQITRGLSMQWNCPVLSVDGFSPDAMALVMPGILVEKLGLLPLRIAGGRILYVAFEDRLDASASLALEQMTGLKVESGVLNEVQLRAARSRLLECEPVQTKFEVSSDLDTLAGRITAILEQKQPIASRLVRLHQFYWLRLWLESGSIGKLGKLPASGEDMCDYVFTIGSQG
jgi:Type II secretion system (T2SS), protein E, N-terminal domain